jgi:hypothetical protein
MTKSRAIITVLGQGIQINPQTYFLLKDQKALVLFRIIPVLAHREKIMTIEYIRENAEVLKLVQAMLGSITRNFRAVFLKCKDNETDLYFVLECDNFEDQEEISEIVFRFESMQSLAIGVNSMIIINDKPLIELDISARMVYARKE